MRKDTYRDTCRDTDTYRDTCNAAYRETRKGRRGTARRAVTVAVSAALLALLTQPTATSAPRLADCPTGALCLWERGSFQGPRQTHELYETGMEECVPLPPGTAAESLANRTGRPVTTYQSGECAETGEFETYPGSGTWLPQSPYRVRAFKLWQS
ncbi:peptidase inhibitor family I36 protein [Streptomyces sp. NPDC020965]|uniref:peptidase inhibitor family I36 protein n=1 Tax=Streptomyces sp. NPDC020965 TaxID=3365105 RepID=UPI003794F8BD